MVDLGRRKDKLDFKYKALPRWTKEGKEVQIKKPVIEVVFRKFSERRDAEKNREVRMLALVDSGADLSFIPMEVAEYLRLDIDKSEFPILTAAGRTSVYKTQVHVEIPRRGKLPIPIGLLNAFVMPTETGKYMPHYVVLGRQDFFDKFEITINERAQTIRLKRLHSDEVKTTKFTRKRH